jgi:hypothetical protein
VQSSYGGGQILASSLAGSMGGSLAASLTT